MRASEFLRRLKRRAHRLGIEHREVKGKGSHLKLWHGSARTVIPMHSGELRTGMYRAILKQLGLTESDLED